MSQFQEFTGLVQSDHIDAADAGSLLDRLEGLETCVVAIEDEQVDRNQDAEEHVAVVVAAVADW